MSYFGPGGTVAFVKFFIYDNTSADARAESQKNKIAIFAAHSVARLAESGNVGVVCNFYGKTGSFFNFFRNSDVNPV